MKVLFDTNVLISYLLASDGKGTIATIIERGFQGDYQFVVPDEVITELRKKLSEKEWLSVRIPQATAEKFITAVRAIAIIPPHITEPIPEVGRDVRDDYLFAYGTVGECDYLVSGDPGVLVVKKVRKLHIISPAEFYKRLREG
jgi:putative PIN family toxin of toxin-antitoxin system